MWGVGVVLCGGGAGGGGSVGGRLRAYYHSLHPNLKKINAKYPTANYPCPAVRLCHAALCACPRTCPCPADTWPRSNTPATRPRGVTSMAWEAPCSICCRLATRARSQSRGCATGMPCGVRWVCGRSGDVLSSPALGFCSVPTSVKPPMVGPLARSIVAQPSCTIMTSMQLIVMREILSPAAVRCPVACWTPSAGASLNVCGVHCRACHAS